jgi:hypothetical protein
MAQSLHADAVFVEDLYVPDEQLAQAPPETCSPGPQVNASTQDPTAVAVPVLLPT